MANAIAVAVKKGGSVGDPDMNFALRLAVDKARGVNMPMENIKRAIERGMGKGESKELVEVTIEGFGPSGEAIIIEAVTDNNNRTIAAVRTVAEKNGGSLGVPGSVMYQFEHLAMVELSGTLSEDEQLALIDSGASDFETGEMTSVVYGEVRAAKSISDALVSAGHKIVDLSLIYTPKVLALDSDSEKLENFVELLSDLDDVSEVYTNAV
jgi:YebC/PmpR family DNA-binding regulatory protein